MRTCDIVDHRYLQVQDMEKKSFYFFTYATVVSDKLTIRTGTRANWTEALTWKENTDINEDRVNSFEVE